MELHIVNPPKYMGLKFYTIRYLASKVLSLFLITDTEGLFIMLDGKVFQNVGVAMKDPPPPKG